MFTIYKYQVTKNLSFDKNLKYSSYCSPRTHQTTLNPLQRLRRGNTTSSIAFTKYQTNKQKGSRRFEYLE